MKAWHWLIAVGLASVLLSGCTAVEVESPLETAAKPAPEEQKPGIYHKVQKGETLWRIAKSYNVSLEDLTRSNKIPNAALVEENQLIFIPGATEAKTIAVPEPDSKQEEFAWPMKGKVVTFYNEKQGLHFNRGINIEGAEGDLVRASRAGRVVFADDLSGYAETIILDHKDGFYSVYAQNAALQVTLGQEVAKGDPISTLGKSGSSAYLHFEIRKNHLPNNPLHYLP